MTKEEFFNSLDEQEKAAFAAMILNSLERYEDTFELFLKTLHDESFAEIKRLLPEEEARRA